MEEENGSQGKLLTSGVFYIFIITKRMCRSQKAVEELRDQRDFIMVKTTIRNIYLPLNTGFRKDHQN